MATHVHTAVLSFDYPSSEAARLVERSVRVEVAQLDDDRSTAEVTRTAGRLDVDIGADDLVALRAGLNSWLRYVSVAEQVADCESTRLS